MNMMTAFALVTALLGEVVPTDQMGQEYISSQEITLSQSLEKKGWHENIEKAFKIASSQSKPLVLAFVGSSWCPWSEKLEEEVLSQTVFTSALAKDFILVRVELPENYSQFTAESLPSLKYIEEYQVNKCPSFVVLQPNGKKIAGVQYLPLVADDFAKYIKDLFYDFRLVQMLTEKSRLNQLRGEEVKTLYTKAGRLADGAFKQAALKAGLRVDKSPFFLLEKYENLALEGKLSHRMARKLKLKIARQDPANQEGSQLKIALVDFRLLSEEGKKPTQQVILPLVSYLEKYGDKDKENGWQLELMISKYLFGKDEIEGALTHARTCYLEAPESAKEEITSSIEYLKTRLSP
ncbi:MAG: Disulfide bond reductase DsbH [Chlamydiae bacterium]|nr:Disulfide bond reductase DsbH [Chlamydiota bacterium]